jgi:uncharacterized protein (DUF934 family)
MCTRHPSLATPIKLEKMRMRKIIKDKHIVDDHWNVLKLAESDSPDTITVPAGHQIVPLQVWLAQKTTLSTRKDIGVWLASDERAEQLKEDIAGLSLIAVDFPAFSDGRGYSIAFNLRSRLGYDGEIRAIGDVLRDQLFYMQRVGFNAFATREDRSIEDALKGLTDFSDVYQTSWDQKTPLYRRASRPAAQDLP